jgi:hypothetical protein
MARSRASGLGPQASGKKKKKRKANGKPKPNAKKKASPKRPKPEARSPRPRREAPQAIPQAIPETSTSGKRRAITARDWATRSSPVVEILDDPYPIGALRRFLDSIRGAATPQQAQIALGAAQLLLLPMAHGDGPPRSVPTRGAAEVKEIIDMVVERWADFGERRTGFHAQELLRNAFAAIGVDRQRIARLETLVPPHASAELRFNIACAHAVARDKVAMLRAVERAIETGASSSQFRNDPDFAPYASDPDLGIVLARADVPLIPVDIDPHVEPVRGALDELVATLRELGMKVELRPPVRLDAILDAERAAKVSLPNDYRALLTITNGMRVWDLDFLSAGDYREPTALALRAQRWAHASTLGVEDCVPIASWGHVDDWLVYDRRGRLRGGHAGYVLVRGTSGTASASPGSAGARSSPAGTAESIDDLVSALARVEVAARDALGTN